MTLRKRILAGSVPAIAIVLFFGSAMETFSQRTNPRVRTTTTISNKTEVREAAEAISIQIKNVSKFVFVLGGVAKGISDLDAQIREGNASREIEAQNRQFKSDVINSIRALRAGLVKIEVDFRAKASLKKYLVHLEGITDQSGRAEDLALAGRFNDSGKELLSIVEKLSDTLVELPAN